MELRDQNGETVRYTRANIGLLASYIEQLKRQASTDPIGNHGPMRMVFLTWRNRNRLNCRSLPRRP